MQFKILKAIYSRKLQTKNLISLILILSTLITLIPSEHLKAAVTGIKIYNYTEKKGSIYTGKPIKITYKNIKINNSLIPGLRTNGITMVSAYDVFAKSKIGAAYSYNKAKGSIVIQKDGNRISMTLGSKDAIVNGYKVKMSATPVLIKYVKANLTRILVPAKFVFEALNYGCTLSASKSELIIKSDLYGNAPGNIAQGGKFIYYNGFIYTTEFDFYLSRMKPDGSGKKIIDEVYRPQYLNIKDGLLYYYSQGSLYRSTLTGSSIKKINDFNSITKFIIYDNYIYYINHKDSNRIYRMNLDGTGRKKLSNDKDMKNLSITNRYIFYASSQVLYRMNLDGSGRLKISAQGAENIVTDYRYVYYIDQATRDIMKVKFDGTGITRLSHDNAINLNISGNTLYYSNGKDYNKLYAITTEGKTKTKILDVPVYYPNIVNGYLYYIPDEHNDGILHKVKLRTLTAETTNTKTAGNYTGNIINDAFTAASGSTLYFCDPWLNRAPLNYTSNTSLKKYANKDYTSFYEINIVDKYMYFTMSKHNTDGIGGIYKMRTDWSEAPVRLTDLNADYLTVIGGWMYFTDYSGMNHSVGSGTVFKMRTDGSDLQMINPGKSGAARCLNIIGEYIYYINESDDCSIYRMNLDGSGLKRLSANGGIITFQVYGENIYYRTLNNKSIMKMPKGGGLGSVIIQNSDTKLIVYQDRIYFFKLNLTDLSFSLYSGDLDGSNIIEIKSNVLEDNLNITAGYVFVKDKNHTIIKIDLNDISTKK